jgi:hypothetical protein
VWELLKPTQSCSWNISADAEITGKEGKIVFQD